jgi:hypothetical protein
MIGLILLENTSIFEMYCLYAKYVHRLYGNTSSLKRKNGQFSVVYSWCYIYIYGIHDNIQLSDAL